MGDISKFGKKIIDAAKKGVDATKKGVNAGLDFINGGSDGLGGIMGYRKDQTSAENKDVNTYFAKHEYGIEERTDTGDINNNTINNILTNVFSGNLFDAGVSAISTKNIHSTWQLATRPVVDVNKYNFLYNLDIANKINASNESTNGNEANTTDSLVNYLDSMEDPTILGYSLMIDTYNSILFGEKTYEITKKTVTDTNTNNPNEANAATSSVNINNPNEANAAISSSGTKTEKVETSNVSDVLVEYLGKYYNQTSINLLRKFREDILKVFVTPSVGAVNLYNDLYNGKYKNHYIKNIKNLNSLDKMFVSYSAETPTCLELELYEDVRLFTTNLKFMYNNFVYNYNKGVRVVPENLLKFNMFIKISEKRTYTLYNQSDKTISKHTPTLIYQLHGCEFVFDESILGDTISMMGSETQDNFANLKIKIKYKKVTRIFNKPYATGNPENDNAWIVDDTYHDLTTNLSTRSNDDIITGLQTNGYRASLSNLIAAPNNSLKSKISKFTSGGFLNPNDNKTLAGKFATTLGNNAIKAGSQFVEEEAKKAKNAIQSDIASNIAKNPVLSGISNNVKNLLKSNIVISTKSLKTMLPTNKILEQNGIEGIKNDLKGVMGGNQIQNKNDIPAFIVASPETYSVNETEILKDGNGKILDVSEDVYDQISKNWEKKPFVPKLEYKGNELDVSEDVYDKKIDDFIKSKEDIVPDGNPNKTYQKQEVPLLEYDGKQLNDSIKKYSELVKAYLASKEDIVPGAINNNVLPNENLNNGIKNINSLPKEDLSNTTFKPGGYIIEDIVPDATNNNVLPKENLNTGVLNENKFTIQDIVPDSNYKPTLPKQDLSE